MFGPAEVKAIAIGGCEYSSPIHGSLSPDAGTPWRGYPKGSTLTRHTSKAPSTFHHRMAASVVSVVYTTESVKIARIGVEIKILWARLDSTG